MPRPVNNLSIKKMSRKLLICIIFTLSFPFISDAFSPQDKYLWIEFQECVKEKDGSVTLPLQINYGSFPAEKEESAELDDLRAFYSLPEGAEEGMPVFYAARIEKSSGRRLVKIKAVQATRFIVFVQAKKIDGDQTHWYFAKTAGMFFGHSAGRDEIRPIAAPEINRQWEIRVSPQFDYWPQTGSPIKITPVFNNSLLPGRVIGLFDENGPAQEITTGAAGSFTYLPPEDKQLNRQGEQAFKQTIIAGEENKGNTKYISSYTLLLHRSRFKNHNLWLGGSIFGGSAVGVFLLVMGRRKRFTI